VRGRGALLLTAAALVAALALFLQRERLIVGSLDLGGFPLDDAWIHFQFARNVASGHGFAFNPDVPMAGSTAPLWTLLLAGGALIAGPSVVMAKTLGVFLAKTFEDVQLSDLLLRHSKESLEGLIDCLVHEAPAT